MKAIQFLILFLMVAVSSGLKGADRLVVLADMGNEPDEEQQMMHLLMCSNEFDIEGLFAVTGKFLRPESANRYKRQLHPELFHELIGGYAQVVEQLRSHATGWPEPEQLHAVVHAGLPGYGMDAVKAGQEHEGVAALERLLQLVDPRPLYVVVNAGSNTLAQALLNLRDRLSTAEMEELIAGLRVYENGAQDDAGAWICHEFPAIHWVRSNYQTYCYGGPSIDGGHNNEGKHNELGPYTWAPYAYSGLGQHQWLLEHVIGNHGPFGAHYPIRQFPRGGISFMEGGGTIPWLCLVNKGLSDINHPEWGGWSGLFTREKVRNLQSKHESVIRDEKRHGDFAVYTERVDRWENPETGEDYGQSLFTPVWRWRRAFLNDFQCRMDWCVQPVEKANHHPVAVVNADASDAIMHVSGVPDETFTFDASESHDPDGDELQMRWWVYPEAGVYAGKVLLDDTTEAASFTFNIPQDAKHGDQFHLILEVRDVNPIAALYDYRRIIIEVE